METIKNFELDFPIPRTLCGVVMGNGNFGADPLLIEAFIEVVKGNSFNTSTLEHGMLSTAIGQATEISRREGRLVNMDELL